MKSKKEDRRIGRTRKMTHDALMELIVEKGYESVTVQDILDRANLGRSTFYSHYRNKDELLLSGFDHLRKQFEQQFVQIAAGKGGKGDHFNLLLELFRHAEVNLKLYRAIVGKQSGQMIMKYVHRYLSKLLKEPLAAVMKNKKNPPVPIEPTIHWLVSSFLSLLTWWLDNNVPYPAEKMEAILRQLMMPGIEAAIGHTIQQKDLEKVARERRDGTGSVLLSLFSKS